ncbi:MAG: YqzL family protein [Firmicutes bacterium]|nr:YqzL family protein [Bacillota bacterium]
MAKVSLYTQVLLGAMLSWHALFLRTERMIAMRDFLWTYFSVTGEIDAYLLYKQHESLAGARRSEQDEASAGRDKGQIEAGS